jgi:hypothetical protein
MLYETEALIRFCMPVNSDTMGDTLKEAKETMIEDLSAIAGTGIKDIYKSSA